MDEHMAFYNDKAKEDYRFLSEIEELVNTLQEETVSEDLKEAADNCYYRNHAYARESFIEGANWQKQQMIKGAVDGIVHHFDGDGLAAIHYNDPKDVPMCYYASASGLEAGDKVKLIIIKED